MTETLTLALYFVVYIDGNPLSSTAYDPIVTDIPALFVCVAFWYNVGVVYVEKVAVPFALKTSTIILASPDEVPLNPVTKLVVWKVGVDVVVAAWFVPAQAVLGELPVSNGVPSLVGELILTVAVVSVLVTVPVVLPSVVLKWEA